MSSLVTLRPSVARGLFALWFNTPELPIGMDATGTTYEIGMASAKKIHILLDNSKEIFKRKMANNKEKSPLQLHTTRAYSKSWGHHADQDSIEFHKIDLPSVLIYLQTMCHTSKVHKQFDIRETFLLSSLSQCYEVADTLFV